MPRHEVRLAIAQRILGVQWLFGGAPTGRRFRIGHEVAARRRMALEGRDVLVVGAGIAGLSAARALVQRGRQWLRGRKQAPELGEVGAGRRSGRTAWLLEASGLCAAAARVASACRRRSSCAATATAGCWRGCRSRATAEARYGWPYWSQTGQAGPPSSCWRGGG